MDLPDQTFTAFAGPRRLASGALAEVALAVKRATGESASGSILVYDDASGLQVEIDIRGTDADVLARLAPPGGVSDVSPRGRGRPKLGVVAREVTLLPRHWDWLSQQPGGASVALRKLVEYARRDGGAVDRQRRRREAAYHFASSLAGNLPGFEEAARALFAGDAKRFRSHVAAWPPDVRDHAITLAFPPETAGA